MLSASVFGFTRATFLLPVLGTASNAEGGCCESLPDPRVEGNEPLERTKISLLPEPEPQRRGVFSGSKPWAPIF